MEYMQTLLQSRRHLNEHMTALSSNTMQCSFHGEKLSTWLLGKFLILMDCESALLCSHQWTGMPSFALLHISLLKFVMDSSHSHLCSACFYVSNSLI